MTTWHWVRHGPTHEKSLVGWRNVPADVSNAAQIAKLRAHLPSGARLVSSDLVRCVATADALCATGRDRLPHQPGLREMHFGHWDGMHFSDVSARDPEVSRRFWETPGDVTAPGGESWNMAAARVQAVVDRLNAHYPDAHVIAVAHFGVILTQVQRALGVSAYETLAQKIDNLSVTEIDWQDDTARLLRVNHHP